MAAAPQGPEGRTVVGRVPTDSALQRKLTYWQRLLRLRDWYVKARWATAHEISGKVSQVTTHPVKRNAIILVGRPDNYEHRDENTEDADWAVLDWEVALVHELLHLHFSPFDADDDSPQQVAQEQAIHAIAAALVEANRA